MEISDIETDANIRDRILNPNSYPDKDGLCACYSPAVEDYAKMVELRILLKCEFDAIDELMEHIVGRKSKTKFITVNRTPED